MDNPYQLEYLPGTHAIHETFADEIRSLGGTVPDVYDDGRRLFARAILPADTEVRPGDHVRAGVAVRATRSEILVQPYTFRQVCSNGAIAAHALEARRLERIESTSMFVSAYDVATALTDVRLAVRASAAPEAFAATATGMRSALEVDGDIALRLLPLLTGMSGPRLETMFPDILRRFMTGPDQSAFGVLNAVTSLARDTRDPETRWQLEELGGALPSHLGRGAGVHTAVTALNGA
jgi:hypothetical protein